MFKIICVEVLLLIFKVLPTFFLSFRKTISFVSKQQPSYLKKATNQLQFWRNEADQIPVTFRTDTRLEGFAFRKTRLTFILLNLTHYRKKFSDKNVSRKGEKYSDRECSSRMTNLCAPFANRASWMQSAIARFHCKGRVGAGLKRLKIEAITFDGLLTQTRHEATVRSTRAAAQSRNGRARSASPT